MTADERPMTGFLATLTDEQRAAALAYRGPENHGADEFRREHAAEMDAASPGWSLRRSVLKAKQDV